jgi:hypothetical protein
LDSITSPSNTDDKICWNLYFLDSLMCCAMQHNSSMRETASFFDVIYENVHSSTSKNERPLCWDRRIQMATGFCEKKSKVHTEASLYDEVFCFRRVWAACWAVESPLSQERHRYFGIRSSLLDTRYYRSFY